MSFPSSPSRLKAIHSVNDMSSQFKRNNTSSSSSTAVNDSSHSSVYLYGTMSSKIRSFFRLRTKSSLSSISLENDNHLQPNVLSDETLKAIPDLHPNNILLNRTTSPMVSSGPASAGLPHSPLKGPRRCRSDNLLIKKLNEAPSVSALPATRTYSSNSIKIKSLSVKPSSFIMLKLLGKGDVGKVYLVKHKMTDKLYALKGIPPIVPRS